MILATDTKVIIAGVFVLGVAAIVLYKKGRETADYLVTEAFNPTSQENLVYKAVSGVGAATTGNKDFSLGSWLFEVWNPEKVEAEKQATGVYY